MSWWHGVNDLEDLVLIGMASFGLGYVAFYALLCLLKQVGEKAEAPFTYYNPGDIHEPDVGWWHYDPREHDSDVGPFSTEKEAKQHMRRTRT